MTWNYAFDVDLEKGVGVGLVVVVKRGEKGIVKLLLLARLIALLTEAEDHLFHFFLRKFGRLSNILDLVPGFLFALCIWHRWEAEDTSLNIFIRKAVTQDLCHQIYLGSVLNGWLATDAFKQVTFLSKGQVHQNRLLSVLDEGLSAFEPLNYELIVIFWIDELIDLFNDLLLDVIRGRLLWCNL